MILGSTEAPLKVFLLFMLFSDWLKSNHLQSRIGSGFLDIFFGICCAITEAIRVTNKLGIKLWHEKKFKTPSLKLLR